ncbi:Triacylglycerol lipase 2 [Striga hermonthica]|uniref:Triacylglycerol lipase 2 n=1 Tax=Striga hermonthica TaxID=68872 RepID=A0A9N7N5C7_STRHE|nr:Triacylglycerol lipase 2 [Striga hermonthica]
MDSRSFLKIIALLGFLSLPHQAFGSSRRLSLRPADGDNAAPDGVCSAAITAHGYKCQEYDVTTDDGYILSVQRIPQGRAGTASPTRPPVLLQHGVLVDGMTWVLNSPEQSLAMILADNGFDVWISNIRGTRFSRRHLQLDPHDPEFWNWTWDDLVIHDLPSVIDLVFKKTGRKIHYVGHSMGTLIALASLSEGKLIDKVKSAALLSPIAYLSHMTTALGNMAARAFVGEITTAFGLAEFDPKGEPANNFLHALCTASGIDCYDLMSAFTGRNCCLNSSTVDIFLKHEPQSTSTKNLVHLAQTVRDGVLSKYDYGNTAFNLEHYGESSPPVYDLTRIPHDFPLFLSYGGEDALSDVKDVATLLDALKDHDVDKLHVQYIKDFAHADFIMGITAKDSPAVAAKSLLDASFSPLRVLRVVGQQRFSLLGLSPATVEVVDYSCKAQPRKFVGPFGRSICAAMYFLETDLSVSEPNSRPVCPCSAGRHDCRLLSP